jgi:chromosomal replication initiator protein
MLSTGLNTAFSIPLQTLHPRQITGESDVGVGYHTSELFFGDAANIAVKYLDSAQHLSQSDWPLVLSGPSGTGKTALALSIASNLVDQTGKPAAIFTADGFRRKFASAVDTNSVEQFHASLMSASVVLIDALHQLSGYKAVQDELIYLLDQFAEARLPVIATVNDQFAQPDCLDHRLVSRLSQGLCINISPPGKSARRTIVYQYCNEIGLTLTDEATDYLASEFKLTYPKIKSFLNSLLNWQQCEQCNSDEPVINMALINEFMKNSKTANYKVVNFILQTVADVFGLKMADLKSSSRKQTIVKARGVAIYLLRKNLQISFSNIGDIFGGKDHSTIMHADAKINSMIEKGSSDLVDTIAKIQHSIKEREILNLDVDG